MKQLTEKTIGAAIEVHRHLGPGLLESSYRLCLCHELKTQGIRFETEKPLPIDYKGCRLDCGYRVDLLVEDALVIEIKSLDSLLPVHEAQLLSYMKLGHWQIGLLINFNVNLLKDGIRRRVLGFNDTAEDDGAARKALVDIQNPLRSPRSLR